MKVLPREGKRAFGLTEFASMFSIHPDSAKRLVRTGRLRTIMVGGRRLVPIGEIERIERDGLPLRDGSRL
jgi:hypothetical protein